MAQLVERDDLPGGQRVTSRYGQVEGVIEQRIELDAAAVAHGSACVVVLEGPRGQIEHDREVEEAVVVLERRELAVEQPRDRRHVSLRLSGPGRHRAIFRRRLGRASLDPVSGV